jgi:5'-3' exonuclease
MEKSLVIVDVSHLAFLYASIQQTMTARVNGNIVDTRIPNGIAKSIWKWSHSGINDVVVCFDSRLTSRRAYIQENFGLQYKPNRSHNPVIREGLDLTFDMLNAGHVNILKCDDFEADDLVQSTIQWAEGKYNHIDVVTGDFDLVPLVSPTVSVHLRSRKASFSHDRVFTPHYYELTPENYEDCTENWSKLKGWYVPYNTILLQKMTYGDESDGIPGLFKENSNMHLYPKKKYNTLVKQMEADGVDFSRAFVYSDTVPKYMLEVLHNYFSDDVVNQILIRYNAMNLNSKYKTRGSFRVKPDCTLEPLGGYFVSAAQNLSIHIR